MIKEKEILVRKILTDHPSARDDYNKLISLYWRDEINESDLDMSKCTMRDFLLEMWNGKLSSTESITRCRRKVQEVSPELRGKTYKVRQEECQMEVLDDLEEMCAKTKGIGHYA